MGIGGMRVMGSIILGSALATMVRYFKWVYEEAASFFKALSTARLDLRPLPECLQGRESV